MCDDGLKDVDRCVWPDDLPDGHDQEGSAVAADRKVTLWFDVEGDFLAVMFDPKPGCFRETACDQVMEKVEGHHGVGALGVMLTLVLFRKSEGMLDDRVAEP